MQTEKYLSIGLHKQHKNGGTVSYNSTNAGACMQDLYL